MGEWADYWYGDEKEHAMGQDLHARVEHDFTNHPPATPAVVEAMDEATRRFIELGHWLVDNVPAGREQSTALTKLEECSMQTKAGIARHQHDEAHPR